MPRGTPFSVCASVVRFSRRAPSRREIAALRDQLAESKTQLSAMQAAEQAASAKLAELGSKLASATNERESAVKQATAEAEGFKAKLAEAEAKLGPQQGPVTSCYLQEAMEKGAAAFNYAERIKRSGQVNGNKVTGIGIGQAFHPAGFAGFDGLVRITPDGKIHLHTGVGNLGTYSHSGTQRVAAEALKAIKAGLVDGRTVTPDQVKRLAALPSREQLLGHLGGALHGRRGSLSSWLVFGHGFVARLGEC